ncbi:discoidin domain-containing protein [Agrobacterium larrymoorei]|uniref:discoidin domain-containing protein n=1 Tax=Agrobacterium larrymoorei TaxID=160699 RepID=UPI0030C0DD3C
MTTPYTTGQISLVNGSAMVTGIGTGWETSLIIGGTIFVEADGGNALPIADIGGDTAITAAIAWTGPTGTYDYALVRDTAYGQQTVANAQALADYIQKLNNTALSAVAGVSPLADTLLLFTGPDTATTIALTSLINGADYDVQVNNLADRAVYDSRPPNFRVLVADIGDGRAAIYSKNSNTAADWSAPAIITGPPGPDGVNPRGTYDPATAYAADDLVYSGGSTWIAKVATTGNAPPTLPTTENTQWRIFARAGSAGVNPRGAYDNSKSYVALDLVLDNGSSWIAKGTTTGNAPPVLPTTENTYWSLLAAKGADGTGTGDVVGPASSVANRVAVFGGTSGKVIIDSGIILGNSASRNVGTAAGTVAAGDDPRFSAGGQNDAILALEIADLKGSRLGMKGGVADAFDDETGVDVKTNAIYDATNDWYAPTKSGSASYSNPGGTGNRSSLITVSSTLAASGSPSALVDGSDTGSYATSVQAVSGKNIRFDFGAGSARYIAEMRWRQGTATTQGVFKWQGSNDGSTWTDIGSEFTLHGGNVAVGSLYESLNTEIGKATSLYRYFQLLGVSGNSTDTFIREVEFKIDTVVPSTNNMTLRSVAYAAAAVPTTGRVAVQLVETDAITINTDVVVRMSRDGGTTWATATLALSQFLIGPKMYEATGINLASLGNGTSIKWEVSTANNKNVAVSGVVAQWS